jgi:hypothetical protein
MISIGIVKQSSLDGESTHRTDSNGMRLASRG